MASQTGRVAPQLCVGALPLLTPTQTFGLCSNILPDHRENNVWPCVSPTDELGCVKCLSKPLACMWRELVVLLQGQWSLCTRWTLELAHLVHTDGSYPSPAGCMALSKFLLSASIFSSVKWDSHRFGGG